MRLTRLSNRHEDESSYRSAHSCTGQQRISSVRCSGQVQSGRPRTDWLCSARLGWNVGLTDYLVTLWFVKLTWPGGCHNPVTVSGLSSWPGNFMDSHRDSHDAVRDGQVGGTISYGRGKCLVVFTGRLRSCACGSLEMLLPLHEKAMN